jgi:hypothetical protein
MLHIDGLIKISIVVLNTFFLFGLYPKVELKQEEVLKIQRKLSSPGKIINYLSKFKYEHDVYGFEPDIKPSGMFLYDKKGDCKDFSNFAHEVAKLHDIPSRLITIWPGNNKAGHALCIWKIGEILYPICNVTCINNKKAREFPSIKSILIFYKDVFKWKKIDDWWDAKIKNDWLIKDKSKQPF